ncbi:MAG: phosphate acyltransferase PlsX [Aggregatilineales bacterium]
MRIVIDAMGSDRHPVPDVEGAVLAARELGAQDRLILVGDQARIAQELNKHNAADLPIEVVHASQHVDMHDNPTQTARQKPDSSMLIAMKLVRDGQADAVVTAGNTGAALTLATLHTLQRIRGVRRPALTSLLRVENNQLVVMADLGANPDAQPEWMFQFGVMGSLYAQHVLGQTRPRVALLSNGEEEGKGNQVVRQSAALFANSNLNFIGNVEPKEVLQGAADVVVTDGFVGNVMLKTMEAVGEAFFRVMRRELLRNPLRILGGFLISPVLRKIYKQVDPFEIGGAPLLGVNGVVIIGHGRTNAKGIKNAIAQARRAVEGNLIEAIRQGMARYIAQHSSPAPTKPRRRYLARRRHKPIKA